jgi:imidazole glycerol-phosphate synthase subunit HisH
MQRIGIIDAQVGTVRPIALALQRASTDLRAGCTVVCVRHASELAACDKLVLPGGRSFVAMSNALAGGLAAAIRAHVQAGKPLLAVSLGMLMLFDTCQDASGSAGLGLVPGVCELLRPTLDPMNGLPLKTPMIGWNRVLMGPWRSPVIEAAGPHGTWMYFCDALHALPADGSMVAATTDHGGKPIVAAVCRDSVIGTWFLPHKSQRAGSRMLVAFLDHRTPTRGQDSP